MSRRKAFGRAVGRAVLRGLILLVRPLPLPAALAVGRAMGSLMRLIAKKRYQVALKNLRIAYGDSLSEAERERIARESFRHFGMFSVELIKFAYLPREEVDRRMDVDEPGFEEFEALMREGKGCLFILAHLGNFEIMARWVTARGYELIALAREARDQGTTEMMSKMRERSGIQVITLGKSLKPVVAGLRRNACIAIVCDQNASDVYVPFFGHQTGTVDGPARIALRMGAPMVFPYCVRDGHGRYQIIGNGVYRAEPTGDETADIERVMTEVNRRLESSIRAYPEQWLWFHDRWRSSPVGKGQ